MKNFALGRYMPLDSWMHSLDPRAKIGAMLLLMVAIFMPTGFIGYCIIGAVIFVGVFLSKLKLNFLWGAMKPMIFMLSFLLIINLLVVKTGPLLFSIMGFGIYLDAITQTLYIVVRLMLMIMITTLLTATTKPMDLTIGIEDLLVPLKKIKVPAHEIAMMISIALRFIPTLIEETQRIIKAQSSRGVDLEEGNIKEKVMAVLSLIVPLFVSSFQRAEDLANAMEARGYVPNRARTRYKQLQLHKRDGILLTVAILVLVGMIALSVL